MARCACDRDPVPSALSLAFFTFRGEGSKAAAEHCLHCRYFEVAHGEQPCDGCEGTGSTRWHARCPRCVGTGVRANKAILRDPGTNELVPCPGFEPHGAWDFDLYYCGCRNWD